MTVPHKSVLSAEILQFFSDKKLHTFVDGTLGAGGHAALILEAHPEIKTFIGIDQDKEALVIARERLMPWKEKVKFFHGNFSELEQILEQASIKQIDGLLLDLGVSSMQLDRPEKGFSFMREGPLDMRMNNESPLTAAEIVNTWSESELGKVFRDYGEEPKWRAAARAIVAARDEQPILTTTDLARILVPVLINYKQKKGINPLTLVFQALRICVNRELEVLEAILPKAIEKLSSTGRMAIISFHSLEDRIVKNLLRFAASDKYNTVGIAGMFLDKEPQVNILTRKPVIASDEEVQQNPRSRSAKLRVIEKI